MPLHAEQLSEGTLHICTSFCRTSCAKVAKDLRLCARAALLRPFLLLWIGVIPASVGLPLGAQDVPPLKAASVPTCLVPKPDWADLHDVPTDGKHIAKAAKNSADTITVDVSKPLPECVAESAKIDEANPALSDSGMLPSDKDTAAGTKVGSANCLLAGLINADFTDCSPSDEKSKNARQKTAVLRENLPLDFVILNIVRWSVVQKKPAEHSDWYLYDRHASSWRSWRLSDSLRILGAANVGFLAVHFGIDDTCGISYTVTAKAVTAQNTADLQQLYSAIATVAGGKLPALPSSNSQTKQTSDNQVVQSMNVNLLDQNQIAGLADEAITNPKAQAEIQAHGIDFSNKEALEAQVASSPDSRLSRDLATITLLEGLDGRKIVQPEALKKIATVDPGVGVYGFATFKGLEKLPYDLTLSGTPTGKPRVYGEKETARVAGINATVEARPVVPSGSSHLSLQMRTVNDEEGHAIGWSIADAPISCSSKAGRSVRLFPSLPSDAHRK